MGWRHQPPVYSPLSWPAVLAAFGRHDPREEIVARFRVSHRASHVLLTDSGTSALMLALAAAARLRPGLPVLLPGYGCYDLATAALGARVRVRLYDIDAETLQPDVDSVGEALRGGAAALVVVHHFGVPVDMDTMSKIAAGARTTLIEDAAQGTGGSWRGVRLGAHGDASILSFGRGKGVTAGGGGALLVREAALESALGPPLPAAWERRLRTATLLGAQLALGNPALYAIPSALPFLQLGETFYREPHAATGLSAAAARVLEHSMEREEAEGEARRGNAEALLTVLDASDFQRIAVPSAAGVPGWLRLPALHGARGMLVDDRARQLGVEAGYPLDLRRLAPLAPSIEGIASTPGADRLASDLLTLPTHSQLRAHDRQALVRWIVGRR